MRIALLDDEQKENRHLHELIMSYAIRNGYDIACETFTSGKELLRRDFLDYVMDEMNGVEVGRALYEKFRGAVTICYLTGIAAAATEVINAEIGAVGFLEKPVSAKLLYEKLDRFYKASFGGRLQLKNGLSVETVYAREIIYAEAADKRTRIHFPSGEETFRHSFSEMERILSVYPSFFRIHRSYIVNMLHVKSYDVKSVMMTNGDVLPLKAKAFAKVYRNFIFNEIK